MPFAQKNYLAIQGINGKYRIDQIGCYLTSFSNLLERFGSPISPVDLNAIFRDRGIYIDVDDNVRDDLGWQSITAYDGQVVVSQINNSGGGWPTSNDSIVRFRYQGKSGFTTHFCLVVDAANHKIIDSYDGQVKDGQVRYGTPTGWATYIKNVPQPVTPPAPVPVPVDPDIISVIVQPGWGISHVLKAAGYTAASYNNEAEWDRVAALNGSPTRLKLKAGEAVKVNKTPLPLPAAPAVTPEPVPAPATPDPAPVEAPVVVPSVVGVTPVADLEASLKEESNGYVPTDYIALETIIIKDISGQNPDTKLEKGLTVRGAKLFRSKEGDLYVRTVKSTTNNWWYGVPFTVLQAIPVPKDDSDLGTLADEINTAMKEIQDEAKKNAYTFRQNILNFIGIIVNLFSKSKNKKAKE